MFTDNIAFARIPEVLKSAVRSTAMTNGRNQGMHIFSHCLVRRVTEDLFRSGVPIHHLLIRTEDHNRVLGGSADQAEFLLAVGQLLTRFSNSSVRC